MYRTLFAGLICLTLSSVALTPAYGVERIQAGKGIATVETKSGVVQGFLSDKILTFKGIPYATAERFQAPQPVKPWQGVKQALNWGYICPQPPDVDIHGIQMFIGDNRFWPQDEDCLNLNVWTPAADSKKRPVMVWLHGGGFFSGSSMSEPIYDGKNLSQKGDVVVVTVNHRLNVLGYLDMSAYGPAYADSGNAGMLDLVAALRWVKENIAAFGGDPNNVTIYGQSGGGAKVATLMTSPQAKGLFNKAIIESGAPGGLPAPYANPEVARKVAGEILKNAGIDPAHADELAKIPYDRLLAASDKAMQDVGKEYMRPGGPMGGRFGMMYNPVVDGRFLPESPFAKAAPDISKGIPLLIGSTLSEFANFPNPALAGHENWGEAEVKAYFAKQFGAEKADKIVTAFRKAYPNLKPNVWPVVDMMARPSTVRAAELKAAQGDKVYNYIFAWRSPILDYAWAAGHSTELPFVFDDYELGLQSTGGGPVVQRLTDEVSQAWINFARSGDPSVKGLAPWKPFTEKAPVTMYLDTQWQARVAPDAELLKLMKPGP